MYTTLNDHYKARFGSKVYKLALDAGFTCPASGLFGKYLMR